jgi:flavodoxin
METLIVYKSVFHGNTKKIAIAMAEVLNAKFLDVENADKNMIGEYDLIGFGSGIYYDKPQKKLMEYIEGLDNVKNRKAFIFSTSRQNRSDYNNWFKEKLSDKGFEIIGEFHCKGYSIFKGNPNEEDLKNAKEVARSITKKYNENIKYA